MARKPKQIPLKCDTCDFKLTWAANPLQVGDKCPWCNRGKLQEYKKDQPNAG